MLTRIKGRLTFANVMSVIAVFLALGGTAYALGRNSVGTPQLKKNAVTGAKIKKDALLVPRSRTAASAARIWLPARSMPASSRQVRSALRGSPTARSAERS